MKTTAFAALTALGLLSAAPCYAQDTTTTTTTTHSETAPGPGVFVGVPGVAGVQLGAPPVGCTTRSSTTTNDDTGASRSMTQSNC
jgi:hypothetical protein